MTIRIETEIARVVESFRKDGQSRTADLIERIGVRLMKSEDTCKRLSDQIARLQKTAKDAQAVAKEGGEHD